jgi:hypothetical protein
MNKRSWGRIALFGALMGTCFTAGVYAQDTIEQVQAYLRKDFNVVVNGTKINLENPPLVYKNNSYLPVKELAGYLGANVNWKGDTNTIFINSRIYPQQPLDNQDVTYDEIKLMNTYAYTFTYLGGEYTVLTINSDKTYYRLKDIQRMGIDTNGLRKAREKYTKDLYVSNTELSKAWKQQPQMSFMSSGVAVMGEKDAKKLQALRDYVELFRYFTLNNTTYYRQPVIMDALPQENEYEYLLTQDGHYFRTRITLTPSVVSDTGEINYSIGSASMENIEALAN